MPTLVQMSFPHPGPWGDEMTAVFEGLARSIADEPGLLWKVWTEDVAAQRAGGVYLFDTGEHADLYVAMHTARLRGFGVTEVSVEVFDVNVALSEIDRARVRAAG